MLAALLATVALAPALAGGGSCAAADARAADAAQHARAVRCLVNAERVRRHLPRLRADGHLADAAAAHARDMVRRDYFDHTGPGGSTPERRVRSAGYAFRSLGETIAWGSGSYGTPASTVARWMASPPHRRILLESRLRDIGVGVARGAPAPDGGGGLTVVADLGRK